MDFWTNGLEGRRQIEGEGWSHFLKFFHMGGSFYLPKFGCQEFMLTRWFKSWPLFWYWWVYVKTWPFRTLPGDVANLQKRSFWIKFFRRVAGRITCAESYMTHIIPNGNAHTFFRVANWIRRPKLWQKMVGFICWSPKKFPKNRRNTCHGLCPRVQCYPFWVWWFTTLRLGEKRHPFSSLGFHLIFG